MLTLLGAWWDFLLGQSEEFDAALEAKLRTNKANVIVEREKFVVVPSSVGLKGILPCFGAGEGVTKFLFLAPEGVSEEDSESNVVNEFNSFLI